MHLFSGGKTRRHPWASRAGERFEDVRGRADGDGEGDLPAPEQSALQEEAGGPGADRADHRGGALRAFSGQQPAVEVHRHPESGAAGRDQSAVQEDAPLLQQAVYAPRMAREEDAGGQDGPTEAMAEGSALGTGAIRRRRCGSASPRRSQRGDRRPRLSHLLQGTDRHSASGGQAGDWGDGAGHGDLCPEHGARCAFAGPGHLLCRSHHQDDRLQPQAPAESWGLPIPSRSRRRWCSGIRRGRSTASSRGKGRESSG